MRYVALFRGINVGGSNKLPMKELLPHLEELGLCAVRYYIQTGNIIFQTNDTDCAQIAAKIKDCVTTHFNFAPAILVLSEHEFKNTIQLNPFEEPDGKKLHFYFLYDAPTSPDIEALDKVKKDTESWHLQDKLFCFHAPDGIGRSKLAEKVEKCLGVACTARNGNTVNKLSEMLINPNSG